MDEVYLAGAARTAIGRFSGTLAEAGAAELGRVAIAALLERAKLDPAAIDEVILGNTIAAGLGQNVARQAAIRAGIPNDKTAMSVNMVCGSGLRAVALAAQSIRCGDARLVVAGGTENMSAAPYLLDKARSGYRMGHAKLVDAMINDGLWDIFNDMHMGVTAENLAEKYGITREMQDAQAVRSQASAQAAIAAGRFRDEIVPVKLPQKKGDPIVFIEDESPRKDVTLESLKKLRPAFKDNGTVTAANSSSINDAAAALIVAGPGAVKEHGLTPMARIVSFAWHGTDPAIMGIAPVGAVKKALAKAGWALDDVELIESNEAFAAQLLAVGKELDWNSDIVNVNGGAIALGHPLGASGARILVTLLYEMARRKVTKGLAALCIGGGMGIAMCVERG